MTKEKNEIKTGDQYLFEIVSFLITSIKRCLNNEREYCPTRLIQTLYQLSFLPDHLTELKDNTFLRTIRQEIEGLYSMGDFWREPVLEKFSIKLSKELLNEIKKNKFNN